MRLAGLSAADRSFEAADGHFLTAEGRVAAWEPAGDGIRVLLDHLCLKSGIRESSALAEEILPVPLKPSDGMIVFPDASWRNPVIGERVICRGKCMLPEKATNPGQFDSRAYYSARGVYFLLREAELCSVKKPGMQKLSPLMRLWYAYLDTLSGIRLMLRRSSETVFGKEDAALIDAVLLGDRSGLSPVKKRLFREGGLIHILAVSGLHIGFFGRGFYRFLRKRRRSFLFSSAGSGFLVLSYCILTGNSISAQRASIMFLLWLGSQIAGRTEDRLTSLSAAAAVILIRQPGALQDSSFLLSFSCILSLELLAPLFRMLLPLHTESGKLFLSSLAIQTGTMPVICWFFYQITPYSILFQLFVLPFMGLFMVFAVLGSMVGLLLYACQALFLRPGSSLLRGGGVIISALLSAIGAILSGPCHFLLKFFGLLCRIQQKLPGSVLITGRPSVCRILLYYAVLAAGFIGLWSLKNTRAWKQRKIRLRLLRKIRSAAAAVCLFLFLLLRFRIRPSFRYTCLDVGQGSCNLIEKDSFVCLFDAGSSSVSNVWDYRIESTLKYYGISKVDMVFLSHADEDHINGIEQLLSQEKQDGQKNRPDRNDLREKEKSPEDSDGKAKDHYNRREDSPGSLKKKTEGDLPQDSYAGSVRIGQIFIPDLRAEAASECMQKFSLLLELAGSRQIPVSFLSRGARLSGNGLRMDVLWPSGEKLTGDANQDCIVLRLTYGHLGILFTGDLEKEGEVSFIREYRSDHLFPHEEGDYTILLAGHHGSRFASSEDLLKLVDPDLVLISCGKNNRYGHPAEEVLDRLCAHGIPWKRTDLDGAVTVSL